MWELLLQADLLLGSLIFFLRVPTYTADEAQLAEHRICNPEEEVRFFSSAYHT